MAPPTFPDVPSAAVSGAPAYVGPDWLRCTRGFAFTAEPPDLLLTDAALASEDPWERLIAVTLRAQRGDTRHIETLIELAQRQTDGHLRDCAVTVFGLAAPSGVVTRLAELYSHPDYDTRLEAYTATSRAGHLDLVLALARHRRLVQRSERERIMDQLSEVLDADPEEPELVDSPLDDNDFETRVSDLVAEIRSVHGAGTAIHRGSPLNATRLADEIVAWCQEPEPELNGGVIAANFALLEGLTGAPYAGCLDDDCEPVLPMIARTLNRLRQSGRLAALHPGRRYFFGHPL